MKIRIEIGDIVAVNFNNAQYTLCSKAEVLSIPIATGDSWIFKDVETGRIHYVSEGCTISFPNTIVQKGYRKELFGL